MLFYYIPWLGGSGNAGTTYVRWGRTECGDTAELVYPGWLLKKLDKGLVTWAASSILFNIRNREFQCIP